MQTWVLARSTRSSGWERTTTACLGKLHEGIAHSQGGDTRCDSSSLYTAAVTALCSALTVWGGQLPFAVFLTAAAWRLVVDLASKQPQSLRRTATVSEDDDEDGTQVCPRLIGLPPDEAPKRLMYGTRTQPHSQLEPRWTFHPLIGRIHAAVRGE